MPSKVLETVLTGRNLLSPVLSGAARDVDAYDAKVSAANARAAESAKVSAREQESATAKVTAANAKASASAERSSEKTVAAHRRSAESSRAFADVSESSAARAGIAWTSLATKALPLAAAAAIVVTGKMAGDYQSLITKLETTAGESRKNLGAVSKGLLDMAGQVGVSADELARGMYTVESAGYHGRDGLLVEKAAAEGAKQENADLGKVTDAVSTILHDYHLKASDAATVTSQLVTAVSHGKTNFDLLTGSLHSVTPLAAKMNISLADVTGTLAAMTASGESADQATQNMANTLQHLANPTNTMINELAQLGISTDDLQKSLSTKGLAGTLQMVEEAIVKHVDPATQRVLIPALNKSKTAAQDLQIMIGQMPPELAKLSRGLLDGSVSITDYQKAAKALGGQSGAMALQFLSLEKSSGGFSNVLKAGGPAAQVFTAAMAKAFGTTAALNVALQTTGENTASTNAAIKDIASSTAQADGNIKGWSEVQGNFNQKLSEAGAEAKSLAIEAGQHLLPVLTGMVGWVASDGLPGIEHLAHGIGDVVSWFSKLPAPVRDAALALGVVKLAASSDMFAGLIASGRIMGLSFVMNMRNAAASVRGIGAAYAEAAAEARVASAIMGESAGMARISGSIAGVGAAATATAKGGLSMLRSGAGSLVSFLGGPWGVGIGAAVGGLAIYQSSVEKSKKSLDTLTASVTDWQKAVSSNGPAAAPAAKHLDDLRHQIASLKDQIAYINRTGITPTGSDGVYTLANHLGILEGALKKGTQAWKDEQAAMTTAQIGQQRLADATQNLGLALKSGSPSKIATAQGEYAAALRYATTETDKQNRATMTANQLLQDEANKALAASDAQLGMHLSQLQLNDAIDQYNKDAHDGQHTSRQLAEEQLQLAQQAKQVAQAAGDAAAAQAKQNGATETGVTSNAAMLASLKETAKHLSGPALDAVNGWIRDLEKTTTTAAVTDEKIGNLGLTVTHLPDSHFIQIDAPTDKQEAALHHLGYVTVTLPNGKVVVTADTHPALTEIQSLLAYARTQSIVLRAGMSDLNGSASGTGRMGTFADGGYTGPGAKYTPAGIVHAGEVVWSQEDVTAHGGPQRVDAMRQTRPGYADGGIVIPTSISSASIAGIEARLHSASAAYTAALNSFSGGGAGSAAIRALGMQIASSMGVGGQFGAIDFIFSHESGWNPAAKNPFSTAFGIPQFLASTRAQYGGNFGDPAVQIRDGIQYMEDRYGSPNAAAAFWAAHHWYDQGGVLPPGVSLAINGTGGNEHAAVFTAPQWESLQRVATGLTAYNPLGTGFTAASAPGYGQAPAPQITVQVLIDGQEFRGMATTVVNGRLEDLYRKKTFR